jgi:tetratricopeptide (TPR) repeat protein
VDELLRDFEKLLNKTSGKGLGGSIDLLLLQMEDGKAEQLKLCAIPHQFDPDILQALAPELSSTQAKDLYEEFINLSIVLSLKDEAAMHDEARLHLFKHWLEKDSVQKFQQANQRLVQYYERRLAVVEGMTLENLKRNRMFHLLGVNQADGFVEFEKLFEEMWHQYRISECETLIHLVHEYNAVLDIQRVLWLTYYEGKLAADLRQWRRAEELLKEVVSHEELTSQLQVKSYHRLGIILTEQRKWEDAIGIFRNVLELVKSSEEHADFVDEVMHDIGIVYRDSGELKQAEKYLTEGLKIATGQNDLPSMALAYNSLGSLQQKLGQPHEAITMYEQSLKVLIENKDKFRPAQVYNNLGLTFADLREWQKSEEFLRKSLEIKRQAGDTRGQAMTLTNLGRVYTNLQSPERAIEVSHQAINLFKEVKDQYNIARTKRNLAKLHRSMNNQGVAIEFFKEAVELFNKCKESGEVEITQIELDALEKGPKGIPWYVWAAIIVFSLLIIFLIIVFLALL